MMVWTASNVAAFLGLSSRWLGSCIQTLITTDVWTITVAGRHRSLLYLATRLSCAAPPRCKVRTVCVLFGTYLASIIMADLLVLSVHPRCTQHDVLEHET